MTVGLTPVMPFPVYVWSCSLDNTTLCRLWCFILRALPKRVALHSRLRPQSTLSDVVLTRVLPSEMSESAELSLERFFFLDTFISSLFLTSSRSMSPLSEPYPELSRWRSMSLRLPAPTGDCCVKTAFRKLRLPSMSLA